MSRRHGFKHAIISGRPRRARLSRRNRSFATCCGCCLRAWSQRCRIFHAIGNRVVVPDATPTLPLPLDIVRPSKECADTWYSPASRPRTTNVGPDTAITNGLVVGAVSCQMRADSDLGSGSLPVNTTSIAPRPVGSNLRSWFFAEGERDLLGEREHRAIWAFPQQLMRWVAWEQESAGRQWRELLIHATNGKRAKRTDSEGRVNLKLAEQGRGRDGFGRVASRSRCACVVGGAAGIARQAAR